MVFVLVGCSASPTSSEPPPLPCDPGPAGTREVTVGDRSFLLHVPLDPVDPAPVVWTFHGRGSNAQQQLLLSGWTQLAEEGRFLVVAPNAIDGLWDFEKFDAEYLRQVGAAIPCADTQRQYASGMSMGSAMTFAMACAPDRKFAAFGGVALTLYAPQCEQAPPAPIIYFHGTADQVVPFRGGAPAGESDVTLPAVPDAMRDWSEHNQCTERSVEKLGKDVALTQWTTCADDADVNYYRVRNGGHTWPGSAEFIADAIEPRLGKTTQTVDATRLMWDFFQNYSLS